MPDLLGVSDEIQKIVMMMNGEMSRVQIQELLKLKHRVSFIKRYVKPAIDDEYIDMTIGGKPNSSKQKYRLTRKGEELQQFLRQRGEGS